LTEQAAARIYLKRETLLHGQALREKEWSRPAGKISQQPVQFLLKLSSARAASYALVNSSSGAIKVSGTKRPRNGPNDRANQVV